MALTAQGRQLKELIGEEPLFFSFFSSPETFETATLTVTVDAL